MKKLNKHTNSSVSFQPQKLKVIHSPRLSTDSSSPMFSLLRLQSVKNNPSLHIMDYNGALSTRQDISSARLQTTSPREQLVELPTSAIYKKKIKIHRGLSNQEQRNLTQSRGLLSDYQFDPTNLYTGQPKKTLQKNLPPETRQLIVEEYITNSHNPVPVKKNLDLLWHQTLNEQSQAEENYSDPKVVVVSEKFRSNQSDQSPLLTPKNKKSMSVKLHSFNFGSAGNTGGGISANEGPPSPKFRRTDLDHKDTITLKATENSQMFRNLELLTQLLRDFLKISQHTFKAKDEINTEQRALHNFILTFAKEIEFAEKIPTKEAKKERLTTLQSLIESRLNGIFTKQELLIDQIQKIKSCDSNLETEEDSQPLEILNVKTNFELNIANVRVSSTISNQNNSSNTIGLAENMGTVKEEVQKLQFERRQYYEKKYKKTDFSDQPDSSNRKNSHIRPSTAYRSTTKMSNEPQDNLNDYKELASNLAMLPRLQSHVSTQNANEPSKIQKSFMISSQNLPKATRTEMQERENTFEDLKLFSTVSIEENENRKQSDSEMSEEKETQKEMQIFFSSALDQLESQFLKSMKEFKVFNREIDLGKKRREIQNTKMTQLRGMVCIENLNEICLKLIKEHESKRKQFLERVKQYLHALEKVVQANILKISSLRNLVATSTAKLYKIQKMRKKINPLDMRDKIYRKNYELKFGQLKEQLKEERESILFIANQVAEQMPNQKESKTSILIEFIENLLNRSVKLLRGAHFVARVGQIEEEYTLKVDQSLEIIDRVNEHAERLRSNRLKNIILNASKIEDAEEVQKELEILCAKLKISQKELLYYREYSFFTNLLARPIDILGMLLQRLKDSQSLLKNSLIKARVEIIQGYNGKVNSLLALKTKFENFVQEDLLQKKGYLDFDLYEKHKAQVEAFESELKKIQTDIKQYVTEKYPQSVAMLPKPEDQLESIKALVYQIETTGKIINTGELFNSAYLGTLVDEATTYTLRDQFEIIRENVAKEIREKELIGGSPSVTQQYEEMTNKILYLLVSLRQLIKHVFDYNDKCTGFLYEFATEYYDKKDSFEELFHHLMLNLKIAYEGYQAAPIDDSMKDHKVFLQINSRLKAIRQGEESLLQGLMRHFRLVKENQEFFETEIEPIAVPCNYLNMLNKWSEKHHNAKVVRERMRPVFDNLVAFRVSEHLPQNFKSIVEDFISQQELIHNSIEVCVSFFEMGKVISEKLIRANLTPKIRTDRSEFMDFLNDFEEHISLQKIKAEHSKGRVAQQFEFFLTTIIKILAELLGFLKIIDARYNSIPHDIERVREMNPKDIIAIIHVASNSLQELEENFNQRLESLEMQLVKKCNIVQAIRDFVEQTLFKEVRIYKKLFQEAQQIQEFTEMIKRDFIWNELTQFKYRQLKSLNIENIEKNRLICRNYITHLNIYLECDEIKERQVVYDVLLRRKTVFVELDKILTLFHDFYELGKDYWIQIDQVLTKPVELRVLSTDLENLVLVLSKIAKNVKTNYEAIQKLQVIEEDISVLSLKAIVVHDIFEFLQQSRKWAIALRNKIDGMKDFDAMIKLNFNGRVFLLREDWLLSIKEMTPNLDEAPLSIKGIKLDYEGLIDRMEEFASLIKEKYVDMKDRAISNVKKYVILLNTKFLNDKFFRAEKSEKVDIITPKLFRLAEKMREKRIRIPNMVRRLSKYCILLDEVLEAVDYLSNSENLDQAGFTEIENMDVIRKYITDFSLPQWKEVMKFLVEKGHSMVMSVKEENQWLKRVETNLNGPIFGKQIDMIKGYWLVHHY